MHARLTMIVVAATTFCGGCGAAEHYVRFNEGYKPSPDTRVLVGAIIDDAPDKTVRKEVPNLDVVAELRTRLELELQSAGLATSANSSGRQISIESRIVDYQPGNAFARWLMPGAGTTVLIVECKLREGAREVGTARAMRTISIGGAYSIGQWKIIFKSVATDIACDLKEQLQGP